MDITTLSLEGLKSLAYDQLVTKSQAEQNLQLIYEQMKKVQEAPAKPSGKAK